jgi:hypothetical protein
VAATPAVEDALRPMAAILEADGYRLAVSTPQGAPVVLEVVAGPDACAECLVPKEVLASIAVDHLARAGLRSELEIRYPADA